MKKSIKKVRFLCAKRELEDVMITSLYDAFFVSIPHLPDHSTLLMLPTRTLLACLDADTFGRSVCIDDRKQRAPPTAP